MNNSKQVTLSQRMKDILLYRAKGTMPVVHFGFWNETLTKWADEGHLSHDLANNWGDGNVADAKISDALGFDGNYYSTFSPQTWLRPTFPREVIKDFGDGSRHVLNSDGVVVLVSDGANSIPAEVDHTLQERKDWDEKYLHRFNWADERLSNARVRSGHHFLKYNEGGLEHLQNPQREDWIGLHCGSLFGKIRDVLGVENSAYLLADDEDLFYEIIQTNADLCYRAVEEALKQDTIFDFAHFWEDICFKNGPLISPLVFEEKVGPHYRRITDLCKSHGIEIISVDCDGMIDSLIPTWLDNGVNTMFPIEVGTWNASIAPWRKKYGQDIRGVGGMNKNVFAKDTQAIDIEVERLRKLIDLGGYIPCPDHRIPPEAKWDLVRYYCDQIRNIQV